MKVLAMHVISLHVIFFAYESIKYLLGRVEKSLLAKLNYNNIEEYYAKFKKNLDNLHIL